MLICKWRCINCVIFVLSVTLPGGMPIYVSRQENTYFMVLSITMFLIYSICLQYKHKTHIIKIILSGKYGKLLPRGRPSGMKSMKNYSRIYNAYLAPVPRQPYWASGPPGWSDQAKFGCLPTTSWTERNCDLVNKQQKYKSGIMTEGSLPKRQLPRGKAIVPETRGHWV